MTNRASPKAVKVLELLNNTNWTTKRIAKNARCSPSYVWMLKKQMAHKDDVLDLTREMELPHEAIDASPLYEEARGLLAALRDKRPKARDTQEGGDHYKRLGVEPWDVFDTWPIDQRIGAYRANCTKYVMRLDEKDTPLLNARKLAHYSQKLVEVLEEADRG